MSGRPENSLLLLNNVETETVWSLSQTLHMGLKVCHHKILKRETEDQWLFAFIYFYLTYISQTALYIVF